MFFFQGGKTKILFEKNIFLILFRKSLGKNFVPMFEARLKQANLLKKVLEAIKVCTLEYPSFVLRFLCIFYSSPFSSFFTA